MASDDVTVSDIYDDTAQVFTSSDFDPRRLDDVPAAVVPVVVLVVDEKSSGHGAALHLSASAARRLGNSLLRAAATIADPEYR